MSIQFFTQYTILKRSINEINLKILISLLQSNKVFNKTFL